MSEPVLLRDVEPLPALRRLPLLTTSAALKYRSCPRAFYFAYERGIRPIAHDPRLRFGALGHTGLEAWMREAKRSPDRAAWLGVALDAIATDARADDYERAKAVALMCGYHARWADAEIEVLAVESEFSTGLANPETGAASRTWSFGGKVDAIVRYRGQLLVMEHKTSSEDIGPGSDYRERVTLDSQVSNYLVGARALGFDVRGCLYDVIGKPAQRPSAVPLVDEEGVKIVHDAAGQRVRTKDGKKWRQTADTELGYVVQTRPETPAEYGDRIAATIAAAPERYYQRFPVVRLADEEREAAFDLWQIAGQIRESRRLNAWPRNPTACRLYGHTCAYLPICLGQATADDGTRFRRVEMVNEELKGDSL